MGKSKQLKFHKIKIKPITFDLYLPTFRANSPKELTRSALQSFLKKGVELLVSKRTRDWK